ncbi:hypothetical protein DFH07DRAFT_800963 [Mycena maculata]|uniref:Uncharacterized protein n=1 Tax=Mycena maculata TaxID=230809 RepID=A0AAD7JY36_9AGAR|nr:hypothetical protein DFH07DRAFT_800963 [Mycena maculata]
MNSGGDSQNSLEGRRTYTLAIPSRLYTVPLGAVLLGAVIGVNRGARLASLRFLAENAHRTPTTQKGWYYYHKTKNYRVILGALRGAGRDGLYLGTVTLGWVLLEEGLKRVGWGPVAMSGAGVGTAGIFCGLYRLSWIRAGQTVLLGLVGGGSMDVVRWSVIRAREY